MVDTGKFNPSCYFDGPYCKLNFGCGSQWLWCDSDGERSDKVGHWTESDYLLSEIDRLWIEEVLAPDAAVIARSMVLTHKQLCWERMEAARKPSFWDKIKQIVMGVRHE
jgi:hypothetical protein